MLNPLTGFYMTEELTFSEEKLLDIDLLSVEIIHFRFNTFQPSVVFHVETCLLVFTTNQMTRFHMKFNTGLKCVYRISEVQVHESRQGHYSNNRKGHIQSHDAPGKAGKAAAVPEFFHCLVGFSWCIEKFYFLYV